MELMKNVYKICKNFNSGLDNLKYLIILFDLLIVYKIVKKRRNINCYFFFVVY